MKTFKTLITILVIVLICNLPTVSAVPSNVVPFDNTIHSIFAGKGEISVTGYSDHEFITKNTNMKSDNLLLSADTLDRFRERGTSFGVYPISVNGTDYPLTGWNPIYNMVGARIDYLTYSVNLKGILVSFLLKTQRGSNYDDFYACVFSTDNGVPVGNAIAMKKFTIRDIDTSKTNLLFTPIMFDNPVPVNSNFACMLTTSNGTNEYDATAIYTNAVGNGNHEKTIVVIFVTNQGAVSMMLADMLAQLGIGDPDLDIMMIPIVEGNETGVDSDIRVDGFNLHNICPNPSQGYSKINFTTEKPMEVEISLVTINGMKVKNLVNQFFGSGSHSIEMNLSDIPEGSYFYTINADGNKFGGKINLVK